MWPLRIGAVFQKVQRIRAARRFTRCLFLFTVWDLGIDIGRLADAQIARSAQLVGCGFEEAQGVVDVLQRDHVLFDLEDVVHHELGAVLFPVNFTGIDFTWMNVHVGSRLSIGRMIASRRPCYK